MKKSATFLQPALGGLIVLAVGLTLGCGSSPAESDPASASENQSGVEVRPLGGARQAASQGAPNLSTVSESTATPEPTLEPTLEPTQPPAPVTAVPQPALAVATQAPVTQPANFTAEAVAALNQVRTSRGLSPLSGNGALAAAAGAYAQYMGQANFFGHYGPDGSSPQSRIRAAGFGGQYKGEALSAGQTSPASAINALLASPAHAAILLEPSSVAVGVGYFYAPGSYYSHYWVVVTGNP